MEIHQCLSIGIIMIAISAYPINPAFLIKSLSNSICYPHFLIFALGWYSASFLSQDVLDLFWFISSHPKLSKCIRRLGYPATCSHWSV